MKSIAIGLLLSLLCLVAWADAQQDPVEILIDEPQPEEPEDDFEPLPIAGFTYQEGKYALSTVVKVTDITRYIFSPIDFYSSRNSSLIGSKHTLPAQPRTMIWPVRQHKFPRRNCIFSF